MYPRSQSSNQRKHQDIPHIPNLFAAALSTLLFLSSSASHASEFKIIPPSQPIADASYEEWSMRWWQWAKSFDDTESPVKDLNGSLCANGQSGDVWYLAGAYTPSKVQRKCRIPSGKYLFFPLINAVGEVSEGGSISCANLKKGIRRQADQFGDLFLKIDDQPVATLKQHRISPKRCFNIKAGSPSNNNEKSFSVAASDGYYVALEPLEPGKHQLEFGGKMAVFWSQDISYEIEVTGGDK